MKKQVYNAEADRRLISLLVDSPELFFEVRGKVREKDISEGLGRVIYSALKRLVEEKKAVTPYTIASELGLDSIESYLVEDVPLAELDTLVDQIREARVRRGFTWMSGKLAQLSEADGEVPDLIARAEETVAYLRQMETDRPTDEFHIQRVGEEYLFEKIKLKDPDAREKNIPLPYKDLSRTLRALFPGTQIVVAGRPGMGKSAFLAGIREHVLESGYSVVSFLMEMTKTQIIDRHISMLTGIPVLDLQEGLFWGTEREKDFLEAYDKIHNEWNWTLYDSSVREIGSVIAQARAVAAAGGVDYMDVDYLQLMHKAGHDGNRVTELTEIAYALQFLGQELDIPVVTASQLSRAVENRQDKRPGLSDLRDSGGIEQAIDVGLFLYRDEYYNENTPRPGIVEIGIDKHRNGPTGRIDMYWQGHKMRFRDLQRQEPSGLL